MGMTTRDDYVRINLKMARFGARARACFARDHRRQTDTETFAVRARVCLTVSGFGLWLDGACECIFVLASWFWSVSRTSWIVGLLPVGAGGA